MRMYTLKLSLVCVVKVIAEPCYDPARGLNSLEAFLKAALHFGRMFTFKLEASRKTLISRIRKKKKKEQGGQWLYSAAYRDKYEFVQELFKKFSKLHADYYTSIFDNRLVSI